MSDVPGLAQAFEAERKRLFGLAYRMLGSAAEAEEVVQDAWLKVASTDVEIRSVAAFLRTVVTRLALDRLRSARARREEYVGPWLPEPISVPDDPDPDSLSLAFLELAEHLGPEERAVVVLHEAFDVPLREVGEMLEKSEVACRKALQRARERLGGPVRRRPAAGEAERMLMAFGAAVQSGDLHGLAAVLAPDVDWRSDGGGKTNAAIRAVQGPRNVARMVLGLVAKGGDQETVPALLNGEWVLLTTRHGRLFSVSWITGDAGGIRSVRSVVNPDKLAAYAAQLGMPAAEPFSWRGGRRTFRERCVAWLAPWLGDPRAISLAEAVLATGPDVLRAGALAADPADLPEAAWLPVLAAAYAGDDLDTAVRDLARSDVDGAVERARVQRRALETGSPPPPSLLAVSDPVRRLALRLADRGEPILAVADLHGHLRHLDALLAWAGALGDHRTVLLGDYLDNGPEMLPLVERLRGRPDLLCIAGNHDLMPLRATGWPGDVPDGEIFRRWYQRFGDTFAHRLGVRDAATFAARIPPELRAWLADLPWVHETDRYCFVHAGMRSGPLRPQVAALQAKELPSDWPLPAQVTLKELSGNADPSWEKVVVSGHMNWRGPPAVVGANRICLSGEVDASEVLYAVVLPARRFVAVGPDLVVREVRAPVSGGA